MKERFKYDFSNARKTSKLIKILSKKISEVEYFFEADKEFFLFKTKFYFSLRKYINYF